MGVSLVVWPGCAGSAVADPAGPPSRLVSPSPAAGGRTTHDGLQDTHRTPTGTGPLPATCGNSPFDGDLAALAAGMPPVSGTGGAGGGLAWQLAVAVPGRRK